MVQFITHNLIWTEGAVVILLALLAILLGILYSNLLFWASIFFLCFSFYFFRNPERVCPYPQNETGDSVIVAPADGKVVGITSDPQKTEGYAQRLSIFLSLLDAHVNWAPVSGIVQEVIYSPGSFTLAYRPKSSELNERNDILFKRKNGDLVKIRQIAGSIARRIVCWVKPGDETTMCTKIGMIRFGSRVDVFLPKNATIQLKVGEQVYGGQTVVGFFR